jgi:hypothetical protein
MKKFIKRNLFFSVIIFTLLLQCLIFFYSKNEDAKMTFTTIGKVYNYTMDAGLDEYYVFKFYYNKNLYHSDEYICDGDLDHNLIGTCFEVVFNSKNPKKCKLNLNKPLDCALYDKSREENNPPVF